MAVDDSYTKLLLHFDGNFTDESGTVWTNSTACTTDATNKVFGSAGLYAPAAHCLMTTNAALAVGTGDFTIDFRMKYVSGYSGVSSGASSGVGIFIQSDFIGLGNGGSFTAITTSPGFIAGSFAHYALVRKSGTCYWFVNGMLKATTAVSDAINTASIAINARYGPGNNRGGAAYYDEFRFSTTARWTSGFTPPSAAYNGAAVSAQKPQTMTGGM
ncbi:MAG: hypothetical protein VB133_08645 [Anaeromusa sp.]|uniref:LamG-like jellyroll fold domain-containing protein n=1 Tax=Anaeromusa sp. TaxID=1872520 RepID=UPI002B20DA97|nr:hypothetical protein [Anaeromusa sp.]MEA4835189.1 hypothetical protein [Anaeromusa sp.]